MKVLVVGGGGREHALVWKIAQSPRVDKIFCAPGNGGISEIAECVPIKATDIEGVAEFSIASNIDLVVVAPDDPLALGMVDALKTRGIRAFGPNKRAAVIEGSKSFSKNLMRKYGIPTAGYEIFSDSNEALKYLRDVKYPYVIKADGLALGKGVIIAENFGEAREAVNDIMIGKAFGNAGNSIVVEEYLKGSEVTVLAFTDGTAVVPMVSSMDHKRAEDGDNGLNTGGMGAISPSCIYTPEIAEYCMEHIFKPTIGAMKEEGRKFKGVLYFGLMITEEGPKVLEYNARFGDPEAQAVLPRLENDIMEIFDAVIDENLDKIDIRWKDCTVACVVMASGGYPEKYVTGYRIEGIREAEEDPDTIVFHAGTKVEKGIIHTTGGRVLGVTAKGVTLKEAVERAYKGVSKISFQNMHYRKDIGTCR